MRILFTIILLFSLSACNRTGPIIDWPESKQGIHRAAPILAAIENYRSQYGVYPPELDALHVTEDVRTATKEQGLLYERNSPTAFGLSFRFTQGSSTPICSYWSETGKWQCLLK